MAGVRTKAQPNGKYVGWFIDYRGKQKFFTGTHKRAESLRTAQRLEDDHRQVRLGYRPVPKSADKQRGRPFREVVAEYLAWDESQGGRGGRPLGERHAQKRRAHLAWWEGRLGLKVLGDLDDAPPRV